MLVYANQQADEVLSKLDTFLVSTLPLLSDRELPLEDRWELYLKIEHLLEIEIFISDSIHYLTDGEIYEVICYDRHQVKLNSEVDIQLHENKPENLDEFKHSHYEHYVSMWEKRDEWREKVLAEGSGGFTFDW